MLARLLAVGTIGTAVLAVPQGASASSADQPPAGYVPANVRVARATAAYWGAHPNDYVGLNDAIVESGGKPVKFNFYELGLYNLSPQEAQRVYDEGIEKGRATDSSADLVDVPDSAFSVSGFWQETQDQYGRWVTFFGMWDFSNSYAAGDDPRDAIAVQTSGIEHQQCWKHDGDEAWVFDRRNRRVGNRLSRKGVAYNHAIWNVNDLPGIVRQGSELVDHGTLYITYQRITPAGDPNQYCGGLWYGQAYFEHNIDGCGCVWSYGFTAGALSITYNQLDPPVSLQKSTNLISNFVEG